MNLSDIIVADTYECEHFLKVLMSNSSIEQRHRWRENYCAALNNKEYFSLVGVPQAYVGRVSKSENYLALIRIKLLCWKELGETIDGVTF